MFNYHQ